MADWEAFRSELEGAETRQPPLSALRERRRRRQQRKAIAGTFAVVLVGSATGLAVLGQGARRPGAPGVSALDPVVTSTKLPPPPDYTDYVVTDVDFVSAATGWALGLRCQGDRCDVATWRTDDGGGTWGAPVPVATGVPRSTYHDEDPTGGAVRSIRMLDALTGYAYNPDLYVTRDGARTWQRLPRESKVTSVSYAGTSVWVTQRGCPAGADCDVAVSAGPVGGELAPLDVPATGGALALVRRGGEDDGYLVAWGGPQGDPSFWRTADGGRRWTRGQVPCADPDAVAMSARGGDSVWLVCSGGSRTAWRSYDSGTTWTRLADPPNDGTVTDLVPDGDRAYLTTQVPGALHVYDSGVWQPASLPRAYGFGNVDVPAPDTVFAMGDAGQLWRTGDGQRWTELALPPGGPRRTAPPPPARGLNEPGVTWTGVSFLDARRGWALGERCDGSLCGPVLRRTADGGETWQRADAPVVTWSRGPELDGDRLRGVVFADERRGWLYGPALYATGDGGATWARLPAGYVGGVEPRGRDAWVVATDGCVGTPCYPRVLRAGTDGEPVDLDSPLVGRFGSFASAGERDAFLVGDTAIATRDGGRTWTSVTRPCDVGSVDAWAPGRLWAVCAGADATAAQSQAVSTDGGRTWRRTPLPGTGESTGEIVAFSETYAWRTGANRGVLVTRDGGRTWTGAPTVGERVEDLTFADERHGWLLAGNVLHRTTDGVTWERLG